MRAIPKVIQKVFPGITFRIPNQEKKIFLTFDDGPDPEVTPKVLDVLDEYQVKATFFCLGDRIRQHPDVFREIKNRGHGIGNHGYKHLDGWKTARKPYIENVSKGFDYSGSFI